jgi:hypothetical protein
MYLALETITTEGTSEKRLGVTRSALDAVFRALDSVKPLHRMMVSSASSSEGKCDKFLLRLHQLGAAVVQINAGISACASILVEVEKTLQCHIRELRVLFYPYALSESGRSGDMDCKAHELAKLRCVLRMIRRRSLLKTGGISGLLAQAKGFSTREETLRSWIYLLVNIL